jgi:putative ABC transport system substrate-binding protein
VKKASHMTGVLLLIGFVFASIHSAEAQQEFRTPVIGFLSSFGDRANPGPHAQAFRQRLRELGYEEGKNIRLEYRSALGRLDHLPALVDELVQLRINVLVVTAQPAINAAKKTTKTIPIVMISSIDPVAAGHVDSLARPGGNLTGVSQLTRDLSAKRVELLKEIATGMVIEAKATQEAAVPMGIALQDRGVKDASELETVFDAMSKERPDAFLALMDITLGAHRRRILDFLAKDRVPAIFESKDWVQAGGLISYGPDGEDVSRRAAVQLDKILKGAKPSEIPVEQPTKFELVINLNTAKQIGLTIPPNLLARADRVIR